MADALLDKFPHLFAGDSSRPKAVRVQLRDGSRITGFLTGIGGTGTLSHPSYPEVLTTIDYLLFQVVKAATARTDEHAEELLHKAGYDDGPDMVTVTVPWAGGTGIIRITDLGWSGAVTSRRL
jgi:hypothetical protein